MSIAFTRCGDGSWRGSIGQIAIFLDDTQGKPNSVQVAVADRLAASLDTVRQQAADYLDLFVDRGKVCGEATEPWWLDEIEMRGLVTAPVAMCHLGFSLPGDEGGYWTVEMTVRDDKFWPIRFERSQG